jgi:hypothetical protein
VSRVSACSFIVETDDLWQRRIERAHYYDAPRVDRGQGEARFVCPGDAGIDLPLASIPWIDDPACSGDPFVRVPQLEKEGITAEILFPTFSWTLLALAEPLRSASLAAYNSWVWNIGTTAPRRLFAAAILPPGDAAGELQRLAPMGFRAAILPVERQGGGLGAFWEAAAATKIPLVLVRAGGAAPFADFGRFARESADLTREIAAAHGAVRFLTFGPPEAGAPANVTFAGSGDGGRSLWARLGTPAAGAMGDGAATASYFNLPA